MNTATGTNNMNTTRTVEQLFVSSIESAMANINFSAEKVQINHVSKREYTKVNQLILVSAQTVGAFKSNEWLTVEQVKDAGMTIRKDEKGVMLFGSTIKDDETRTYEKDGETKPFKIKKYNYYYVFNLEQLETKTEA